MTLRMEIIHPLGEVINVTDAESGHVMVIEPGHPDWEAALKDPDLIPYQAPSLTESDLMAFVADLRWRKETGGIKLGGIAIATDDRSKLMLSGARIAAMADPSFITRWKTPNGWVDLTAVQIIAISDAVQAHVAACFALEANLAELIEAGTITTLAEVEAAFA